MHCNVMIIIKYFLKLSSEQLCIEIAWEAIVLSGNKHFAGGVHYPGAIFPVAIIWGYISVVNYSAGQQFVHQLPKSKLSGGQFPGQQFSGSNYPRGNYPGRQLSGGNYPWGNCPAVIIQGAIVLFPFFMEKCSPHIYQIYSTSLLF